MQFPGVVNAWTMPIKARIDMLSTGVRTPIGIKVLGSDLKEIERIGSHLEMILNEVPGTRSVFAERTGGGYFLDFVLKRDQLARYGLTVQEAEMVLMTAVGGEPITTTVEGRERYTINVRYARDLRSDLDKLRRVLVPIESGAQVPLAELAEIKVVSGPGMIRDENGMDVRLRVRGSSRARCGRLRRGCKTKGGRRVAVADRLLIDLEWPVREHAAG